MNQESEEKLQQQPKNRAEHLKPWQFKKGQSGNPFGRPPGPSLKERAKSYLAGLTDEEAIEFFEGMNKKDVWEMAEGKAKQDVDFKGTLTISDVLDSLEDGQTTEGQDVESQSSLQDTQQGGEARHL